MTEIRALSPEDFGPAARIFADAYPGFKIATEEERKRFSERALKLHEEEPTAQFHGLFRHGQLQGMMCFYDFSTNFLQARIPAGRCWASSCRASTQERACGQGDDALLPAPLPGPGNPTGGPLSLPPRLLPQNGFWLRDQDEPVPGQTLSPAHGPLQSSRPLSNRGRPASTGCLLPAVRGPDSRDDGKVRARGEASFRRPSSIALLAMRRMA